MPVKNIQADSHPSGISLTDAENPGKLRPEFQNGRKGKDHIAERSRMNDQKLFSGQILALYLGPTISILLGMTDWTRSIVLPNMKSRISP